MPRPLWLLSDTLRAVRTLSSTLAAAEAFVLGALHLTIFGFGTRRWFAQLAFVAVVAGCSSFTGSETQQLRVTNAGTQPLSALRVFSPDTMISFGDIPGGATSGYLDVPGGVYSYAAFFFNYNGSEVRQRVDDFVGEVPMKGRRFTYVLELVTLGNEAGIVIKSVTKDR
jgi:hypothetical protein